MVFAGGGGVSTLVEFQGSLVQKEERDFCSAVGDLCVNKGFPRWGGIKIFIRDLKSGEINIRISCSKHKF